ncbi:MAG TPA: hypothetical protein VMU14_21865, partial [Acidimicrobiales bacterium]|nr:hypothetical protein [Acidimicrobiales bacterium]
MPLGHGLGLVRPRLRTVRVAPACGNGDRRRLAADRLGRLRRRAPVRLALIEEPGDLALRRLLRELLQRLRRRDRPPSDPLKVGNEPGLDDGH